MKIWALFVTSCLLVVFAVTAGIHFGLRNIQWPEIAICCAKEPEVLPIIAHGIAPKELYDGFYEALPLDLERNDARSAVVAHHLVVGKEIANIFETVGDESVQDIILISPNHFDIGSGPALTAKIAWETPYGEVQTNTKIVDALVRAGVAQTDARPFEGEHGINSLTPFVKRSFPNARIIPLIVHESLTQQQAEEIALALHDRSDLDALVIASADMSHNLPLEVQQFHDDLTRMTLASGELKHELEIDSNAGLRVLFELNRLRRTQTWNETYHGSSLASGVAAQWADNTSHILGYFMQGAPAQQEWTSFFFGGDIMLDRGTRKKILAADTSKPLGDPTYPWEYMKRFTMGVDLRIANLEGTVNEQPSSYTYDPPFRFVFNPSYVEAMKPYIDIVSLANNHAADVGASKGQQETHTWLEKLDMPWFGKWETPSPAYDFDIRGMQYRLIGFHAFQPDTPELLRLIKEGDAAGRFVIVMPHWGIEYEHDPFYGQKESAQLMIDAGADLIVGGHPHVVQGIELRSPTSDAGAQVPVIYSLGNFVFDQQIPITWDAMALGVIHTQDQLMLYFLPIGTKNSQPIPYGGSDAARVLRTVADASPVELQTNILQAKIISTQ